MTIIRPARRTTRRRLPRHALSTAAATLVLYAAVLKTWPVPVAVLTFLAAVVLVSRALRPTRLRPPHARTVYGRLRSRRVARTLAGFLAMSPEQFEHAVAALTRQHPHVRTATTHGGSGDRGVDVLAQLHDGRRILIQCKRYRDKNVGGDTLREILGSVIANRCTAGVIVTTSGFTREALATNATLGPNRLTLVDGPGLVAWANGGRAPWQ